MAYGDRYTLYSSDVFERKFKVQIQQKDYIGKSESVIGSEGSPVVIGFEGTSGTNVNKYDPIKSMYCSLTIYSQIDYQFIELFTSDADKYKVIVSIYENNQYVPWFIGYIEPDIYEEPYIMPPYEVTIRAVDGLVRLKDSNFENTGLNDTENLLNILLWCLNQTGLELDLETFGNIYETRMIDIDQDSVFLYTYVKLLAFIKDGKALSVYEVIENILTVFGCSLIQYKGRWVVGRIDERFENVPLTFKYHSTGLSDGYGSFDQVKSFTPARITYDEMIRSMYSNTMLMVVPAWEKFKIIFTRDIKSILENSTIKKYTLVGSDKIPTNWTLYSGGTGEYFKIVDFYDGSGETVYDIAKIHATNVDTYIISDPVTTAYRNYIFNLQIFGNIEANIYITVTIESAYPTLYLAKTGDEYLWSETPGSILIKASSLGSLRESTQAYNIKLLDIVTNHLARNTHAGDITVKVKNGASANNIYIDSINLFIISKESTYYVDYKQEIETLVSNNNYNPSDLEVIIGDIPNNLDANLIFKNCLLLQDGTATDEWFDSFSEFQSQLLLCQAYNMGRQYVKPSLMLQGTFKGTMDFLTTFVDESNLMRKFVWSHQVEYNVKQAEFHGYMVELLPAPGTKVLGDDNGNALEAATDELIEVI